METLAISIAALPVALFFAIWVPLAAIAMGIYSLPDLVNPETYEELINWMTTSPEWQPEALIENLKEMLQATLEMQ